jgi:hypothetical protein
MMEAKWRAACLWLPVVSFMLCACGTPRLSVSRGLGARSLPRPGDGVRIRRASSWLSYDTANKTAFLTFSLVRTAAGNQFLVNNAATRARSLAVGAGWTLKIKALNQTPAALCAGLIGPRQQMLYQSRPIAGRHHGTLNWRIWKPGTEWLVWYPPGHPHQALAGLTIHVTPGSLPRLAAVQSNAAK